MKKLTGKQHKIWPRKSQNTTKNDTNLQKNLSALNSYSSKKICSLLNIFKCVLWSAFHQELTTNSTWNMKSFQLDVGSMLPFLREAKQLQHKVTS